MTFWLDVEIRLKWTSPRAVYPPEWGVIYKRFLVLHDALSETKWRAIFQKGAGGRDAGFAVYALQRAWNLRVVPISPPRVKSGLENHNKNVCFTILAALSNTSESIVGRKGPRMVYQDNNDHNISFWTWGKLILGYLSMVCSHFFPCWTCRQASRHQCEGALS